VQFVPGGHGELRLFGGLPIEGHPPDVAREAADHRVGIKALQVTHIGDHLGLVAERVMHGEQQGIVMEIRADRGAGVGERFARRKAPIVVAVFDAEGVEHVGGVLHPGTARLGLEIA
jgi:hypothetical protein